MNNPQLSETVCRKLLEHVDARYGTDHEAEITCETPLLEQGIIDSLSMMSFILFLEQEFGLDFTTVDITREDFQSINVLAAMVVRVLSADAPSGPEGGSAGGDGFKQSDGVASGSLRAATLHREGYSR